jgi:ribonuclease Z
VDLDVMFIGTAGSAPTAGRGLPATLVRRGGDRLLFDCGEGTQRQMLRSIGLVDLEEIFLTHFHADHFLGLPGMLKTFGLRGREAPLTIYGPPGLRALFEALRPVIGGAPYDVKLVELEPNAPLERDGYLVAPFTVDHRVNAYGYVLVEQDRPGRFDEDRARELGVTPGPDFGRLQSGEAVSVDGHDVLPDQVLGEARRGRKLVLTGDTAPADPTRAIAHGADLLVHEATFTAEEADRAAETGHSTARGAAELAAAAEVALLALTHVSPRHPAEELRAEAREVFDATIVPRDFDRVEIPFPERGGPVHHRREVSKGVRPL